MDNKFLPFLFVVLTLTTTAIAQLVDINLFPPTFVNSGAQLQLQYFVYKDLSLPNAYTIQQLDIELQPYQSTNVTTYSINNSAPLFNNNENTTQTLIYNLPQITGQWSVMYTETYLKAPDTTTQLIAKQGIIITIPGSSPTPTASSSALNSSSSSSSGGPITYTNTISPAQPTYIITTNNAGQTYTITATVPPIIQTVVVTPVGSKTSIGPSGLIPTRTSGAWTWKIWDAKAMIPAVGLSVFWLAF